MLGLLSKGASLKFHWRRYQKLDDGSAASRRRVVRAELGNGRRLSWRRRIRIKFRPRLRLLRRFSVKGILTKIRDAYVNMMLGVASSGAINGHGFGYGIGDAVAAASLCRLPPKEYDNKMIIEIYNSVIAQGQMLAAGGNVMVKTLPSAVQTTVRG